MNAVRLILAFLVMGFVPLHASEESAFLKAIRENPDDDTVRLVYADWLEEHAQSESERARAEFIRVQIAWSQFGDRDSAEWRRLRDRAEALMTKYRQDWVPPPLRDLASTESVVADEPHSSWALGRGDRLVWRRGFVEAIALGRLEGKEIVHAVDSLPALDHILYWNPQTITTDGHVRDLVSLASLSRVRGLSLPDEISDAQWRTISGKLTQVERLMINVQGLTADGLAELVASSHALTLRDLTFRGFAQRYFLDAFWNSDRFKLLESLTLIGDLAIPPPARRLKFPSLTSARLFRMDAPAVEAFIRNPLFGTLRNFEIRSERREAAIAALFPLIAQHGSHLTHFKADCLTDIDYPPHSAIEDRLNTNRSRLQCSDTVEKLS